MSRIELPFEQIGLDKSLATMSQRERAVFAAASAEVLAPLNDAARATAGLAAIESVRAGLDAAWRSIGDGGAPPDDLAENLMSFVPDEDEDGWNAARSLAGSATSAVVFALRAVDAIDDVKSARSAGFQVYDVSEAYLQFRFPNYLADPNWAQDVRVTWATTWLSAAVVSAKSDDPSVCRGMAEASGLEYASMFALEDMGRR